MLKSLPSALVWMYTSSLQSLKAYWRSMKKKMPKSVGARTKPCFTSLLTGKASEVAPCCAVHVVVELCHHSKQLWGAIDLFEEFEESTPADQAKAFVKPKKVRYRGICCSWHFS